MTSDTRIETDAVAGPAAPRPSPRGDGSTCPTAAGRTGWTLVLLTSLGIAAFALSPYLTQSLAAGAESGSAIAATYATQPLAIQLAFYAHIVGGGIALVAGPFQFWRGLRARHPKVHRWTGRVYLVAIAIGGLGGLVIAPVGDAGLAGLFGFGTLAVLWLVTGWRAYVAIRRRDVASHRAWMIRNFALTYSAVMLRIWLPLLIVAQVPFGSFDFGDAFENAYAAVPFLAWLPNLVVAEWIIRRRGLPSYRLGVAPEARPAAQPAI
ncbi:DUF2306 domain-containing protein [Agromyces sp. CFH 90414]|uniref:DUF2306 domain-containing protein n=1 Tax=Agromyces agglutinans TaxID=2662258 RepID=A0A6I2F2Z8_9MICO|nr:DUF2306 domain-containing protein [Agromyces agglutinans]MRG58912.1 DUF2306 domain-containing protein [Agromyces agglutinans]